MSSHVSFHSNRYHILVTYSPSFPLLHRGAQVLVDGAHALGSLSLSLRYGSPNLTQKLVPGQKEQRGQKFQCQDPQPPVANVFLLHREIGADYYASNAHKWFCCPKVSPLRPMPATLGSGDCPGPLCPGLWLSLCAQDPPRPRQAIAGLPWLRLWVLLQFRLVRSVCRQHGERAAGQHGTSSSLQD